MSFEDEYVRRPEKKDPINAFLPILGLILAIALGAVSWVLSDPIHELLIEQVDNPTLAEPEAQYAVAAAMFLVLILVAGMIYAAFAPKPPKVVSEHSLKKERAAKHKDKENLKKRKRQLSRKAAKERTENAKKQSRS